MHRRSAFEPGRPRGRTSGGSAAETQSPQPSPTRPSPARQTQSFSLSVSCRVSMSCVASRSSTTTSTERVARRVHGCVVCSRRTSRYMCGARRRDALAGPGESGTYESINELTPPFLSRARGSSFHLRRAGPGSVDRGPRRRPEKSALSMRGHRNGARTARVAGLTHGDNTPDAHLTAHNNNTHRAERHRHRPRRTMQ